MLLGVVCRASQMIVAGAGDGLNVVRVDDGCWTRSIDGGLTVDVS